MEVVLGRFLFDVVTFAYLVFFVVLAVVRPSSEDIMVGVGQWSFVFAGLVVIGAGISLLLRRFLTLGSMIYEKRRADANRPLYRTVWGVQLFLVLFVTLVLGVRLTEIDPIRLIDAEPLSQAFRLFSELANPNWKILPKAIVKIIESIYIAFMATALAFPIAFVLSFLTARNLMSGSTGGRIIYTGLRFLFNFARSVEPVLWAILFSIWVSFGPFAGMLALMIHSIASLAKQYSEIVEGISDAPVEGIEATGANRLQTVWFAVVPQVVLPFISFTIYRWDTNLRMATILGFVGGGGIGAMLMEYQGQARWAEVGTIIVVIAAVVWIMDAFSAHVREAVR